MKLNNKANTPIIEQNVILPLPPTNPAEKEEMAVYARFMRHLRHVPNSRMEIKILSAIQFTADMLDFSDAHVAKMLVDMGLRAARIAFPSEFLSFADQSLMRKNWEIGAPSKGVQGLKTYWDQIGEDKFAAFKGPYSLLDERAIVGG